MSDQDYVALTDIISDWAEETGDSPAQLALLLEDVLSDQLVASECTRQCIPIGKCDCTLSLPPQSGESFVTRKYKSTSHPAQGNMLLCENFVWRREIGFPEVKAHKPVTISEVLNYFRGVRSTTNVIYAESLKPELICLNKGWLRHVFSKAQTGQIPSFLALAKKNNINKVGRKPEQERDVRLQEEANHIAANYRRQYGKRPTKKRVAEQLFDKKIFDLPFSRIERILRVTW